MISDIDDTILHTGAQRALDMVRQTFTGSELTRVPFAGAPELYRSLASTTAPGGNPFFYVSSSPWNLYGFLRSFLRHRHFPMGPLLLRDLLGNSVERSHATHKHAPDLGGARPAPGPSVRADRRLRPVRPDHLRRCGAAQPWADPCGVHPRGAGSIPATGGSRRSRRHGTKRCRSCWPLTPLPSLCTPPGSAWSTRRLSPGRRGNGPDTELTREPPSEAPGSVR